MGLAGPKQTVVDQAGSATAASRDFVGNFIVAF